ncbi:hypothetical protein IW245_003882 [Longispora fulva]|uniref:Uncharacterized protein n=1 Tax=Longispora fulva TaxID=619741 RepID=A0A8J7GBY0_9ACTN|nr:hypothetical protein [Longispora fulva]
MVPSRARWEVGAAQGGGAGPLPHAYSFVVEKESSKMALCVVAGVRRLNALRRCGAGRSVLADVRQT